MKISPDLNRKAIEIQKIVADIDAYDRLRHLVSKSHQDSIRKYQTEVSNFVRRWLRYDKDKKFKYGSGDAECTFIKSNIRYDKSQNAWKIKADCVGKVVVMAYTTEQLYNFILSGYVVEV